MTPRYYEELCRQHRNKVQHEELLFAQIGHLISFKVFKKALTPEQLMPSRMQPRLPKPLSEEEREAKLAATFAFMDRMVQRSGGIVEEATEVTTEGDLTVVV
jgi:hypothetical protein